MFIKPGLIPLRLDEVLARETARFDDRLVFTFEISSASQPTPIVLSGHDIVRFTLDLRRAGFTGGGSFKLDDESQFGSSTRDLLIELFRTPQLLRIRLAIAPEHLEEDMPAAAPQRPLILSGLVTEKTLIERTARHAEGGPLSFRLYQIRFADPAQVLWRQHFPLALYTQTSLEDVITQNSNQYVSVQFLDPTLAQVEPLIFLGLSVKNRPQERASFYDLLMWRLDETQRMWVYDYAQGVYQVHKIKLPPTAIEVVASDIEEAFTYYPMPPRAAQALLDDYTEQPQNRPVPPAAPLLQQNLVSGVRDDFLFNTPIASEFEQELQRRTEDFTLPGPEFVLRYRIFPSAPIMPGAGIDFNASLIDFQTEAIAVPREALAEICRVFRVRLSGDSEESDVRPVYDGRVPGRFTCRINVWLEAASNPARRLPPYILPKYPVHIEGKILSEVGQPIEETYQFYPHQTTSINQYKVKIPLWNNQIVSLPYNPNLDPGHFYFPAYKDERILVALYYDRAYLKRFLDWRPTAQLPLETQGDQLLLGKTPVNRTAVRHTYQNELPVFEIERLNMLQSFDTELLQMAEGSVLLQVGTPLGAPPPAVSMSVPPPSAGPPLGGPPPAVPVSVPPPPAGPPLGASPPGLPVSVPPLPAGAQDPFRKER